MAEEKLQYTLTLATRATGTGAKEVAADLQKVAAMSSLAADKAKVSSWAHYNLDEAMGNTAKRTETVSSGITKVGKSSRDSNMALLMFSQGFEDAQYGIRGVLNNIPPLVMALGGTAGLAGVVSLAAVSFSMLGNVFDTTKKQASDTEDQIRTLAESMVGLTTDKLDLRLETIDAAADAAEKLKQNFEETHKAENAYATAALSNAEKIAEANRTIAELLGLQVNRYAELQAVADAQAAQQAEAARQAADAESAKLEKTREAAALKADRLTELQFAAVATEAELATEVAKLETLRAQRAELEKIAKQKNSANMGSWSPAGVTIDTAPGFASPAAKAAQKQLESTLFKGTLQGTEDRVVVLREAVEKLTAPVTGMLDKAAVDLEAARNQVADTQAAVAINLAGIQETLAADTLVAQSASLKEATTAQSDQLKSILGQVEPQTAAALQTVAALQALTQNGQVTADESGTLARNLTALMGGLQTGIVATNANLGQLLPIIQQMQAKQASYDSEIKRIAREQQRLGNLSATLPQR
jgi:hypothetical protein